MLALFAMAVADFHFFKDPTPLSFIIYSILIVSDMRTNTRAVPFPLKGRGEEGDMREGEEVTTTIEGAEKIIIGVSIMLPSPPKKNYSINCFILVIIIFKV